MAINGLNGSFAFEQGAVSRRTGELRFREAGFMSSAAVELGGEEGVEVTVPVLPQERIIQLFPPPYDLVKIDVEGSELDFLEAYDAVLSATSHLILEWHSWHSGGGGETQIREVVARVGFVTIHDLIPAHAVKHNGQPARCGVLLCTRTPSVL